MRKTVDVTIAREGRDKGKTFVITEMSASQTEKWAARAFLALARSGIDIPDDIAQRGMAGLTMLGFKTFAGVNFADVEPLMDEMMRCIQVRPNLREPMIVRAIVDTGNGDDIEEVMTRVQLRGEWFALHSGFSFADALSKLTTADESTSADSQNTGTSPAPSGQ